jgi:hypothetical protein
MMNAVAITITAIPPKELPTMKPIGASFFGAGLDVAEGEDFGFEEGEEFRDGALEGESERGIEDPVDDAIADWKPVITAATKIGVSAVRLPSTVDI